MKKLSILAVLQAGFILAWAAHHEQVRASAPTIRIPLQPRDPYDLLRGRYFVLNPRDRAIESGSPDVMLATAAVERFLAGEHAYAGPALVGFCRAGQVHRVCDLHRPGAPPAPSGGERLWSPARATVSWPRVTDASGVRVRFDWSVELDLHLERFFLPDRLQLPGPEQAPGWELEVSWREGQPLLPRRLWFRGAPLALDE
jgi:hypothetical protein